MKKIIILSVAFVLLNSCDLGNNVKSTDSQTTTEKVNNELSYLSENELYEKAMASISNYEDAKALNILQYLKNKFPNYQKEMVDTFIKTMDQKIKEKEELANKGFSSIKENKMVTYADLIYTFSDISIGKTLIADRYEDRYFYWEAERGNKFIINKFSIKSESKDPLLCPILIYKQSSNSLELIGKCFYKFNRWKDYGTYLGNYIDRGNSFVYSEKINFVAGYEIQESELENNAIFIVLKKDHCAIREEDRFANPPISYNLSECGVKNTLTTDDFLNDYVLIKVFGKIK